MLDCAKKIGLTMTESSMLTPTKSVTAVIGLGREEVHCHEEGCESCSQKRLYLPEELTNDIRQIRERTHIF